MDNHGLAIEQTLAICTSVRPIFLLSFKQAMSDPLTGMSRLLYRIVDEEIVGPIVLEPRATYMYRTHIKCQMILTQL